MPAGAGPRGKRPYVKINGKRYVLQKDESGKPVYASGTRLLQKVPSDDFTLDFSDMSGGIGVSYAGAKQTLAPAPGLITPATLAITLDLSGVSGGPITTAPRYSFEAQDSNGVWYKYVISPKEIVKIHMAGDASDTARRVYDAASVTEIDANDRFGQAIKVRDSGNTYWLIPCNNANRILRIDDPVAVDTGAGSADSFTVNTALTNGASHFRQRPDGGIVLATSSHSAGVFQNRATLRYLDRGLNPLTDANWSGEWEVGAQTDWIVHLDSFNDMNLVRKQDGWYTAIRRQDGSIAFKDLLPEGYQFNEVADFGEEAAINAANWGGELVLTTPGQGLWRHRLTTAWRIDPSNTPLEWQVAHEANLTAVGQISAVAAMGKHLWCAINNLGDGTYSQIIVGTLDERRNIRWESFAYASGTPDIKGIFPTRNAMTAGMAQMYYAVKVGSGDYDLKHSPIGQQGDPYYSRSINLTTNDLGTLITKSVTFPSPVIMRESRIVVERDSANMDWTLGVWIDDDSANAATEIGSRTDTGSIFWTAGVNDQGQRWRFQMEWDSNTLFPVGFAPALRRWTVEGTYLPDVGESIGFNVDLDATSRSRKTSVKAIRDELDALVKADTYAWVDVFGNTGTVIVDSQQIEAPVEAGAKEVRSIRVRLEEYS